MGSSGSRLRGCGAVPGILEALIIEGDVSGASENLAKAKAW